MRIRPTIAAVLFLGLAMASPLPVGAEETPDPEALQAAKDLFAIMSPEFMSQIMGQMGDAVWPDVVAHAKAHQVDDATIAGLRKEFDRIELENVNLMMQEAPPIYARYFTADELRQLAAFYRTPIGQKGLRVLPQVLGDFFNRIGPVIAKLQTEVDVSFKAILAAHGYPPP
jgi:uncharacterized protein